MKIPREAKFLLCLGLGTAISSVLLDWAQTLAKPEKPPKEGIQKVITELDNNQETLDGLSETIGNVRKAHLEGDKGTIDLARDSKGNTEVSLRKNDGQVIRMQRKGKQAKLDDGSGYPVFYELNEEGNWVEMKIPQNGLSKLNRVNTPSHIKDGRSYSGNTGASL